MKRETLRVVREQRDAIHADMLESTRYAEKLKRDVDALTFESDVLKKREAKLREDVAKRDAQLEELAGKSSKALLQIAHYERLRHNVGVLIKAMQEAISDGPHERVVYGFPGQRLLEMFQDAERRCAEEYDREKERLGE